MAAKELRLLLYCLLGCLEEVLGKHSNELSSLQMAALNFLAVLLSEEGKRKQKNGISNGEGISLALNQPTGSGNPITSEFPKMTNYT